MHLSVRRGRQLARRCPCLGPAATAFAATDPLRQGSKMSQARAVRQQVAAPNENGSLGRESCVPRDHASCPAERNLFRRESTVFDLPDRALRCALQRRALRLQETPKRSGPKPMIEPRSYIRNHLSRHRDEIPARPPNRMRLMPTWECAVCGFSSAATTLLSHSRKKSAVAKQLIRPCERTCPFHSSAEDNCYD